MDDWWVIGFAVAAAVVVIVALLLIGIWWEARRIARLAETTVEILDDIERQTRPIWQLQVTARQTKSLADGLGQISGRSGMTRRGSSDGEAA